LPRLLASRKKRGGTLSCLLNEKEVKVLNLATIHGGEDFALKMLIREDTVSSAHGRQEKVSREEGGPLLVDESAWVGKAASHMKMRKVGGRSGRGDYRGKITSGSSRRKRLGEKGGVSKGSPWVTLSKPGRRNIWAVVLDPEWECFSLGVGRKFGERKKGKVPTSVGGGRQTSPMSNSKKKGTFAL